MRTLVVSFGLMMVSCISVNGAGIGVIRGCGGTPAVGTTFSFEVPAPVGGVSEVCLDPTVPFVSLDLSFPASDAAPPITCDSTIFSTCLISQRGNTDDVMFEGGAGLPAGVDFEISLQGFAAGQSINGAANAPEPGTLRLLGIMISGVFAINALRRATRRAKRDTPVSVVVR
ncbi:MAG: hypothetical protein JO061_22455 [Acidobacteriaceae bacterium]|nr:hypothetical protein [Acidobacteriaceae bacterium]